ncbi:DEAD/DEAH box helicase [Streptomyces sp. NPDC059544]|uniref:DEAD/DEAH box helicase n=1 Tax=Streptomyces sp. NPDC059544 TaxID=3346861 RepID=UPI003682F78C
MTTAYAPRPYQADAIKALTAGWQGSNNRLAVVLPTGAGKTVVFSNLILDRLATLAAAGHRALVIAHREELLTQAADKIKAVAPSLRVGIVKAERDEHQDADVIVASIQTLAVERRRQAIQDIGLVIVDECHHAAAPSYMTVLEHFGAWSGMPVAGFTATMTRTDGGLADVWQEVVFTLDILDMIEDGYLCDVRGKRVVVEGLDLDKVKTRAGDLQDGQLGQALDDSGAATVIADAYKVHASDRPGVVFTPTVATAQSMADAFTSAGIPTAAIWGDMPRDDRAATLKAYRAGDLQVLTNCMVLTEGFDAPWTSCAVIARPTKSAGLYCQMAGRALRLWEGKKDALILDVMGASTRHKLASIVDLTGKDLPQADPDESLRETSRRADEEKRRLELAQLEWEDVNLFHGSTFRWLRTEAGFWFLPVSDETFLFLVRNPASRTYWMRRWDAQGGIVGPQNDVTLPLAQAMHWMERQARALGRSFLTSRAAGWRSKPATARQLAYCRHQRIQVPPGSTAGDVSDLQAIHKASAILRRFAATAAAA